MYAALYVVDSLDAYHNDAEAFFVKTAPTIKDELLASIGKSHDWKLEELIDSVKPLEAPRSYDVGLNAFKVGACIACHKIGDDGVEIGPDLTKLDVKKQNPEHILRSLIDPSGEIDEKYQPYTFVLTNGKVVTGMILKDDAASVTVTENPLAKTKPVVLLKKDIDEQVKSKKSIMPEGLLGKLTREEILDLVGFIHAGGDKKKEIFGGGHEHHEH